MHNDDCAILLMFRMTHQTRLFNLGQKVWIIRMTGAQAAQVRGKHRGKGRFVKAWVKWNSEAKTFPEIKEIKVTQKFYDKIRGDAESDEGYSHLL